MTVYWCIIHLLVYNSFAKGGVLWRVGGQTDEGEGSRRHLGQYEKLLIKLDLEVL